MPGPVRHRASLRLVSRATLPALVAAAALAPALSAVPAGATGAVGPDGLSAPSALAVTANTLFVANRASGTVSLLNATTGALVGVASRTTVGVGAPIAIAATSGRSKGRAWHTVLVASAGGTNRLLNLVVRNRRTVAVALGAVRPGVGCGAKDRAFIGVDAANDYVVVCSNGATWTVAGHSGLSGHQLPSRAAGRTVTSIDVVGATLYETVGAPGAATGGAAWNAEGVLQVSLATGKLVGSLTNASCAACGFDDPDGVAALGAQVWVSDAGNDQATQLSSGPLAFVATQTSNLYNTGAVFAGPAAVYFASVDGPSNSMVTMFTTAPVVYRWMMCNTNDAYLFDNPASLTLSRGSTGATLWVANPVGGTVGHGLLDQMDARSGALVRTIG